ncbi:MAG: 3'-5' exonuclease, partial [Desulfosalsimonas sp.]
MLAPEISARELSALKSWGRKQNLAADGLMAEALRLDAHGLSQKTKDRLRELLDKIFSLAEKTARADAAKKLEAAAEALAPFLPAAGRDRTQAFEDLKNLASSFGKDMAGFLETLALYSDPDFFNPEAEKVSLLTMHAAKGLEFPVVFVAGCEDGLIPHAGSARQQTDPGEERRLFYVAMTRAMEELFLVSAKNRRIHGRTTQQNPSR